jgi:phenylpyruvate tautomerase PptA (4-oxalocrotonate tautomerase family)
MADGRQQREERIGPMAQVKIYGLHAHLNRCRAELSDAIHDAAMDTLGLPPEKRFHRFIGLDAADFVYPADRGRQYTIVEVSMFEGRSVATKKAFVRALFERIETRCGIAPQDVEITITETPRENWGIRGLPADELTLTYDVEV